MVFIYFNRTARDAIAAKFPKADLTSRKDFLNQSIDKILSESQTFFSSCSDYQFCSTSNFTDMILIFPKYRTSFQLPTSPRLTARSIIINCLHHMDIERTHFYCSLFLPFPFFIYLVDSLIIIYIRSLCSFLFFFLFVHCTTFFEQSLSSFYSCGLGVILDRSFYF